MLIGQPLVCVAGILITPTSNIPLFGDFRKPFTNSPCTVVKNYTPYIGWKFAVCISQNEKKMKKVAEKGAGESINLFFLFRLFCGFNFINYFSCDNFHIFYN